ncbi:hypothetical protein MHI02_08030 [Oceanobacillus sp. FSL K6-0118]|uniref:hypothetical protein n=1 Tax=Oceanobacillus sp. FSL K6-0118 TaxID=2921418 RepID=UPI0030F88A94
MELVERYLDNKIAILIIETYLEVGEENLDENIDPREALQYLLYWNVIPDNIFQELYAILENKSVTRVSHGIYNRFLRNIKE